MLGTFQHAKYHHGQPDGCDEEHAILINKHQDHSGGNMEDEILSEEFSIMFEESQRVKVLDATLFTQPVKHLKVRKPLSLAAGSTVNDAIELLKKKEVSCLLVTKNSKLAGILTERDIVRKAIGMGKDMSKIRVEDIMTPDPESFEPDDSIAYIIHAMDAGGYRHIPVVDEQNVPIAIVSVKDIIGFIAEHFSQEVRNLPPKPMRSAGQQDGG
jgi:CBS domain-containing protein